MRYDTLETELVAKLNSYFTSQSVATLFEAVAIAENESEAGRISDKGRLHVMYSTSRYEDTNSTSSVQQPETVTVAFIPECGKLRGNGGVYHLVDLVKKCLLGYTPANGMSGMKIAGYGDWQLTDGVLQNVLELSFKCVNMQVSTVYPQGDDLVDPAAGNLNASIVEVKTGTN